MSACHLTLTTIPVLADDDVKGKNTNLDILGEEVDLNPLRMS